MKKVGMVGVGCISGIYLKNFHEVFKDVELVAVEINRTGIEFVCTGHCTKDRAYEIMKKELGDKLNQLHVGLRMEF